ncbi:hypothetical protein [Streptomyces sp. G45]|uniref:hypothetical protein n=1 Tax=Streptomyces sp. G45 TaxID=3406627 RepID=UPI003C176F18
MLVVIPEDPYWAELFYTLDDPLLHQLTWFYGGSLSTEEQSVVRRAYAAYDRVLARLPSGVRDRVLTHATSAEPTPGGGFWAPPEPPGGTGRALQDADGRPLTPMHVVDVSADVGPLRALNSHVKIVSPRLGGRLHVAVSEISQGVGRDMADVLGRTLGVLTLAPPPALVTALATAEPDGPAPRLTPEGKRAYDEHREMIVHVTSGYDEETTALHRLLYA